MYDWAWQIRVSTPTARDRLQTSDSDFLRRSPPPSTIYNGRIPITCVFKLIRKS